MTVFSSLANTTSSVSKNVIYRNGGYCQGEPSGRFAAENIGAADADPNLLAYPLGNLFLQNQIQQKNDHGGEEREACPAEREKDGAAVDILQKRKRRSEARAHRCGDDLWLQAAERDKEHLRAVKTVGTHPRQERHGAERGKRKRCRRRSEARLFRLMRHTSSSAKTM